MQKTLGQNASLTIRNSKSKDYGTIRDVWTAFFLNCSARPLHRASEWWVEKGCGAVPTALAEPLK